MPVNLNYIEQIRKIIIDHKHSWGIIIKQGKKYNYLLKYILDYTKNYQNLPFKTKVYWTLNQITKMPICYVCKKNEFPIYKKCDPLYGYDSDVCSCQCAQKDPRKQARDKKANLLKYGVENISQIQSVRDKISKTKQNKNSQEKQCIQEKRIKTCINKYGVENISQLEEIKNKKHNTYLSHSLEELKNIQEKIKNTKLLKYGNEKYCNSFKISQTKQNFDEKKKQDILYRTEQTNLKKYNVKHPWNTIESINSAKITREKKFYLKYILKNKNIKPLFSLEEFLKYGRKHKYQWLCNCCNEIFEQEIHEQQLFIARCFKCNPKNKLYSNAEKDISNFIISLSNENKILLNDRSLISPKELDIVILNKKIAIEYDGLYWHSEKQEDPNNCHLIKTNLCNSIGFQLIHVFENEWMLKQDIVKSRLKNLLGIYDKTIFARKCQIKEVDSKTSNDFQDKNHLQGAVNCKVNIGLFYENELVSLMTFSKPRFDKKHDYELVRFCNKLGYHIPGAAGKLLKHFEKMYNPKSLVSYADRRWSQGKLYYALGFKLDHISKPNYWYWNYKHNGNLESRVKYQKYKLASLLKSYDANLTEYQNMSNNGYLRIFDSGNLVFIKQFN